MQSWKLRWQDKKHGSAWGVLTWKGARSAISYSMVLWLCCKSGVLCAASQDKSGSRACAGVQQQEQPIRIQGSLKRVWRLKDGAESGARLKGVREAEGGGEL